MGFHPTREPGRAADEPFGGPSAERGNDTFGSEAFVSGYRLPPRTSIDSNVYLEEEMFVSAIS